MGHQVLVRLLTQTVVANRSRIEHPLALVLALEPLILIIPAALLLGDRHPLDMVVVVEGRPATAGGVPHLTIVAGGVIIVELVTLGHLPHLPDPLVTIAALH